MIKENMVKTINDQINAELYSSYLYLAMSAQCADMNLSGAASWFRVQAQEELIHAMKFFDYINERGGIVVLDAIEKPNVGWGSLLEMFEAAYAHEQYVTGRINDMVDIAIAEKDHAAQQMLQWFVAEQVEEESSADDIVQKLKMAGDFPAALMFIDQSLANRVMGATSTEA